MTDSEHLEPWQLVAPRRLHPASPLIDLAVLAPRSWPLGLLALSRPSSWQTRAAGLLVVAVVVLAARAVVWWRTTYSFDGRVLSVHAGVWNRTATRVPVDRVQQVEVVRTLRHQAFGVSLLRIQLAGGTQQSDVSLEVLGQRDAMVLRDALEQARRSVVLGDSVAIDVPPPPEHALVRLGPGLLALGGVTGASLLVVPVGMVALITVLDDLRLDDEASDLAGDVAAQLPWFAAGAVLLAGALVIAATLSVVRHHGYVMVRRGNDLTIRRGLFDQRTVTVPIDRVHVVRMHRNVVRRWLGIGSLDITTAGRGDHEGSGSANDAVPVARWAELEALLPVVLGQVLGAVPLCAERRAVPAAVRRSIVRRGAIAVVFTAWVPVVGDTAWRWAVPIGAAVLGAGWGWAVARVRRHDSDDEVVVVEAGPLAWTRTILPIGRAQSWRMSQSPMQRRSQLADLTLDVGGGRAVHLPDITVDEARAITLRITRGTLEPLPSCVGNER